MFAQGEAFPEIAGGIAGAPDTARILGALVPQAFTDDTDKLHTVNEAGQFTETALRLVGPVNDPHVVFQL